jgi:hypothetical protein
VITGIPAWIAASISGCSAITSATEIKMPAGFAATAFCNSASSPCGS